MNERYEVLAEAISARFSNVLKPINSRCGELTFEVEKGALVETARALRDETQFRFEMLIDLCGVDNLSFGSAEWETTQATSTGFSRAAIPPNIVPDADTQFDPRRFEVVYHLLSISLNQRLRLKLFCGPDNPPAAPSVVDVWNSANWYEREAFDLYGILYEGHPDLRRLLTDYGFIGHPFRKDFPLSGNVEVIYDPELRRVVYQPVSIEPRVLVPKVIRAGKQATAETLDDVSGTADAAAEPTE
jgi:NADH-quinone oxidoreductase subunit C